MKAAHMKRRRARRDELRITKWKEHLLLVPQPEKNTAQMDEQRDGKRFYLIKKEERKH